MIQFFETEEEEQIINAIRKAEECTTGEIRVHIERNPTRSIVREAMVVFKRLGMHKTKDRNGVLILLAPQIKEFAIVGDKGIDAHIGPDFWEKERDLIQEHFRRKEFAKGICLAIQKVGEQQRALFPSDDPQNENELSDQISYDD